MRKTIVLFILAFFFSVCVVCAEENPAIKILQERVVQAKKIEKAGLRAANDLADEITVSSMITAVIQTAAKVITNKIDRLDIPAGEELNFAEITMSSSVESFQKNTTVPVVEKSFAYLVLKDIAILKGDTNKAKEYTKKAFENLRNGVDYYKKIAESPFALYNLVYFNHLAENVFKLGEKPSFDKEKAFRLLQEYPLINERMHEVSRVLALWDDAVSKVGKKNSNSKN